MGRTGNPAPPDEPRVLIVDDEPDVVDEVSSYLRGKGFLCDTAFDGEEAIRKIENTPEIAIVVTDIRMPRLDGLEMMRRLRGCSSCSSGSASPVGVASSAKAIVCCKRWLVSTLTSGRVLGTSTSVGTVSRTVIPSACRSASSTCGLA